MPELAKKIELTQKELTNMLFPMWLSLQIEIYAIANWKRCLYIKLLLDLFIVVLLSICWHMVPSIDYLA